MCPNAAGAADLQNGGVRHRTDFEQVDPDALVNIKIHPSPPLRIADDILIRHVCVVCVCIAVVVIHM